MTLRLGMQRKTVWHLQSRALVKTTSYVTEFPIFSAVKLEWRNILCARKFGLSRRPSRGVRQVCQQWEDPVISYGTAQVQLKLAVAHF